MGTHWTDCVDENGAVELADRLKKYWAALGVVAVLISSFSFQELTKELPLQGTANTLWGPKETEFAQKAYFIMMSLAFEFSLTCVLSCTLFFAQLNYLPTPGTIAEFVRKHESAFILPEVSFILGAWMIGFALPVRAFIVFGHGSILPWTQLCIFMLGGAIGGLITLRLRSTQVGLVERLKSASITPQSSS